MEKYLLPCFNKWLFGFDCPGCGMQRALLFLARGDWAAAWERYPPVFTTVLMALGAGLFLWQRKGWQGKMLLFLVAVNVVMVAVSYYFRVITNLTI